MTVTVCIGNTDNKLTQQEWADYIRVVRKIVKDHATQIYFEGFALPDAERQNACWVFWCSRRDEFMNKLSPVVKQFGQDSIAVVAGQTEFVKAAMS